MERLKPVSAFFSETVTPGRHAAGPIRDGAGQVEPRDVRAHAGREGEQAGDAARRGRIETVCGAWRTIGTAADQSQVRGPDCPSVIAAPLKRCPTYDDT